MPRGPRGEHRPADLIGRAVQIMRIATGEGPDDCKDAPAPIAAAQLGELGGAGRARALTPEKRTKIARKGAEKKGEAATLDCGLTARPAILRITCGCISNLL